MGELMIWAAVVAAVMLTNLSRRADPDAQGMSLVLALTWALSNVLVALYPWPDCVRLFSVMDVVGGLTAYLVWLRRRATWKIALAWLFLLQCLVHVAFWGHEVIAALTLDEAASPNRFTYVLTLNVLFVLQLGCVGFSGVRHVVGAGALDRLFHRARARPSPPDA